MQQDILLNNWSILCDSLDFNSINAVENLYKKWKDLLLNSVSENNMTMLMSAAKNNNMRVFSFLMNENIHNDLHGHALEYAITNGNYIIARELLTRKNHLYNVNVTIKSPIYNETAKYHCAKMNALLKEFHEFAQVEKADVNIPIEIDYTAPPIDDISIDDPEIHLAFVAILTGNTEFFNDFNVIQSHNFYYKKYRYTGEVLECERIYTTPLIEALDIENMQLIDLFIEKNIIYPRDYDYLNKEITECRMFNTRILLYKETLHRLKK